MTKTFLISCAAIAALAASGTANASLRADPPADVAAVQAAPSALFQLAKHGADDPDGHDRNDDRGGAAGGGKGGKGRGGKDDGPRHT